MHRSIQEPYLRFILIMILEKFLHAQTFFGTRYELQIEDKILGSAIIKTFSKQNKIHCASLCYRDYECVGFGINVDSCTLLKIFMSNNTCEQESCSKSPGMKIYMKEQEKEITTTTTVVSTSTKQIETTSTTTSKTTSTTSEDLTEISVNETTATYETPSTADYKTPTATYETPSTYDYKTPTATSETISTVTQDDSIQVSVNVSAGTDKPPEISVESNKVNLSRAEVTSIAAEILTVLSAETTSTTTEKSSTSATTTTVTDDKTTTTTTGPDIHSIDIKCDVSNHVLQGLSSRETMFFGGKQYQSACVTVGAGSSYVNDEEKYFTFEPPDKGQCSGYTYPGIKHMKLRIENKVLKKITIFCGELKEERVNKDAEIDTINSTPENKKITCKDKQVLIAFTATRYEEGHYKVEADCRELQNPAESQDTPELEAVDTPDVAA